MSLLPRIFGSRNDRLLLRYGKTVKRINALADQTKACSDDELRQRTAQFRQRLDAGESLDDMLVEAFATVREAAERVLGMRHFDVQLIGGMVLHAGNIAEMRTGEGKTLVATLAAYLNALPGKGVHVVTVNDYLAKRDAAWMDQVYQFLGLTTGVVVPNLTTEERQRAYGCDITYGTNNEFGFDYLRDNMAFAATDRVQREKSFAIVDEVDSILIDEARTPLIISGPAEENTDLYGKINKLIPLLSRQIEEEGPGDFSLDEKSRQVHFTEAGHERVEELLLTAGLIKPGETLYDPANITLVHHLNAALRAHTLFTVDVDYVVDKGEVVIVDEFTGRLMAGRRWSEGLHQAVEAKEGVRVKQENQTLASITFQNYFRLYSKLSGMTGTADTEAFEFQQIYGLEVVVIPTHHHMIRQDNPDQIYLSKKEKYQAVLKEVSECNDRGQPVLVGTASIDTSELVSGLLKKASIPHQVLNAKYHEQEAEIIAQAGALKAVTIATNMAGRGTDIVLGGSPEGELGDKNASQSEVIMARWQEKHDQVVGLGGLHVIGTERNESRRVDNQLRGRSGRQGDPGSSRFFLSLEDDLMRIFASDRVTGWMQKLGLEEGEAIEHKLVTNAIERAQKKVEGRNFEMRKQLLEYDDIANEQRVIIYDQRNELLDAQEIAETILVMRDRIARELIDNHAPSDAIKEQWDLKALEATLQAEFGIPEADNKWQGREEELSREQLTAELLSVFQESAATRETRVAPEVLRHFEKAVMLQVLDNHWKEHLAAMDYLRQGIFLRGYAQKNPKQEYKKESFVLFNDMLERIRYDVVSTLSRVQVRVEEDVEAVDRQRQIPEQISYEHDEQSAMQSNLPVGGGPSADTPIQPFVRGLPKVGRNDPCPCGEGKKYKHCHGRLAS